MSDNFGTVCFEHDIQVAHRLFKQPGKCQQIHGHSMHVILYLTVRFNEDPDGYATDQEGNQLEFGDVKKRFREHLDSLYDHRLLLNNEDPWAGPVWHANNDTSTKLPGLIACEGDPSTENICKWIADVCANMFKCDVMVDLEETKTNSVQRSTTYISPREGKINLERLADNSPLSMWSPRPEEL